MADIMLGQLLHRPTIDPISGSSPLPVQLSGKKVEDGTDAPAVSTVTDPDGNPVVRVVDAAPFAYDSTKDVLRIRPHARAEVETLLNNWVIVEYPEGSGTGDKAVIFESMGASEIWAGVQIDKQPWSLARGELGPFGATGLNAGTDYDGVFPRRNPVRETYTRYGIYCMALIMPFRTSANQFIEAPTTLAEAKLYTGAYLDNVVLLVQGPAGAKVTLKIMRVWK